MNQSGVGVESSRAQVEPNPGSHKLSEAFVGQPKAVWVTAFAAVVAFMGIGLVDPILHSIAEALNAGRDKVTLLFGVYMGVQVFAMLITGWSAYRFGPKRTLVSGLVCIVAAAGISATASGITELILMRVLWGLGNALFIATALAFIVGAARGGQQGAILLYEAALGFGLAVGPLLGAVLGEWSWRAPFAGTAILMTIGAVLCTVMLPADEPRKTRQPISIRDPLRALRNRTLSITGVGSAFYTAAFFTVIAWTPLVLGMRPIYVGLVFFGWGVMLAVSGVVFAPRLAHWVGERTGVLLAVFAYAIIMALCAVGTQINSHALVIAMVVLSGIPSGLLNTLFTGVAMASGDSDATGGLPRSVSSAGYNFLRWMGAAASALLVAQIATWFGAESAPFWAAAVYCCLAFIAILFVRINHHTVPADAALQGDAEM